MGSVIASATMSLDGYIAHEDHTVDPLFDWYEAGEVEVPNAGELPPFRLTRPSADYWRAWQTSLGVLVVGRTLFDVTDGWGGTHPLGVPVVVLTHQPPEQGAPAGSTPFSFVTGGIEEAIDRAQLIAGDAVVGVAAGTVAGQALTAGLLDEVNIDLAPVLLGGGRPYFADVRAPVRLGDALRCVPADRVTHLGFAAPGRRGGIAG